MFKWGTFRMLVDWSKIKILGMKKNYIIAHFSFKSLDLKNGFFIQELPLKTSFSLTTSKKVLILENWWQNFVTYIKLFVKLKNYRLLLNWHYCQQSFLAKKYFICAVCKKKEIVFLYFLLLFHSMDLHL